MWLAADRRIEYARTEWFFRLKRHVICHPRPSCAPNIHNIHIGKFRAPFNSEKSVEIGKGGDREDRSREGTEASQGTT
jgi:hypothetical protein